MNKLKNKAETLKKKISEHSQVLKNYMIDDNGKKVLKKNLKF